MMFFIGIKQWARKVQKVVVKTIFASGLLFLLAVGLALTDLPFWGCYHLAVTGTALEADPHYIVVMGAGGMPGPEGLMRCHTAARAAETYPCAKVVIAMPTLPQYFASSHTHSMYREMVLRGVDSTRFLFETTGTNTRDQALGVASLVKRPDTARVLIVSSPEHLYRAVRAFRKAGFAMAGGRPAFESGIDEDLLITEAEKKQGFLAPNRMPGLRYNLWNYMKLEIDFMREVVAIGWYKWKGWI